MRAGALRYKLEIQENVAARDGYGGKGVPVWHRFKVVFGTPLPASSSENVTEGQEVATVDSEVTIRFVTGVTPAMRIRLFRSGTNENAKYFEITKVVDPDGRRRELRLSVRERA